MRQITFYKENINTLNLETQKKFLIRNKNLKLNKTNFEFSANVLKMSLATAAFYRTKFRNKRCNNALHWPNE